MDMNHRLTEHLALTLRGEPWHGPALMPLLDGITAEQAAARPWPDVHTVWELVHHVATWQDVVCRRLAGTPYDPPEAENFPAVTEVSEATWAAAKDRLEATCRALQSAIAGQPEAAWDQPVPGMSARPAFDLVMAIIQHNTYHAGQIALLCKYL